MNTAFEVPPEHTRLRRASYWFASAAVATPVAIVLHELGHWAVARAFRFPNLVLRYGSITHDAAQAGHPEWQLGLAAAAGPAVTLLIVVVCCLVVARIGPHPVAVAGGIGAGIRSVIIGVLFIPIRLLNPESIHHGNFDELNAARSFGLPVDLVIGLNLLLLLGLWWFLISRIPRSERTLALLAITAGMAFGLVVYIGWLGPAVLP